MGILKIGAITSIILFIVVIGVLGASNLEERIDTCNEKGGILVKTVEGFRCLDVKVLK